MWSVLLLLTGAQANPWAAPPPPVVATPESQPFRWQVPKVASAVVELTLEIPVGFAVYRDQLRIELSKGDVVLGEPEWPEAKLGQDPSDPERTRALYDSAVSVRVPIESGSGEITLSLTHQGCRKGLCWPSTVTEHTLVVIP